MPTNNFTLIVPKNTVTPISKVVITLNLTDENAATFTITDPEGSVHAFAALSPPPAAVAVTDSFNFPAPDDIPRQDRAVITRNPAVTGDPRRKFCTINLNLNTDFDPNTGCVSTMPGVSESWTISVAGTEISGVCQVSLTRTSATGCIGANANILIVSNNPAELATIDGKANQQCGLERSGADIVLVLDRSGSMSSPSQLGGVAESRIEVLHDAVIDFVGVWGDLLAIGDRLGIVTFDDLIETPAWIGAGLQPFDAALEATVTANISSVTARGMTSIGGGLIQGANTLIGGGGANRRVMLLMSDGQQNTDPMVGANPPAAPNLPPTYDVFTYNEATPAIKTPLPGLSAATPYQIYTVTVGPSAVVEAAINDNIAKSTGGFYINSEDDGLLLRPFFLELLGNFVRFNSWETARLIHGSVAFGKSYVTQFALATTTQRVVINLSWPQNGGVLTLRVEPPHGVPPTPPTHGSPWEVSSDNGSVRLAFNPTGLLDPVDDWTLTVEQSGGGPHIAATAGAVDFDVVILVDDLAVKSELLITPADYKAGDNIQLELRLSAFGEPAGLGADARDRVVVQVVHPGQSIGDLLSDSSAGTNPPQNGDKTSPTQAKLFNLLQQNPDALGRNNDNPDSVTLLQTSPGVYTGNYRAEVVGHYNFLFGVEGMTDGAGRCSRQEIKSVYVRATPDTSASDIQTSVQNGQLSIVMTPKTKTGNRMGPGWANYFWFTTPGRPPLKARDNMNGTYSLDIPFTGLFPPPVAVHFIDVLMVIGDSVTPDKLPVPLDDSTVWVPAVPQPPFRLPWWLIILLLILLLLLILWLF